jgi:hypothetical protein
MTQADSVHSTPRADSPSKPSRRHMLAGLAILPALPARAVAAAAAAAEPDPIFALIETKRAADTAHGDAIDVLDQLYRAGDDSSEAAFEADEKCEQACHFAMDLGWQLARTAPISLAGVVAVLRFANQFEDEGMDHH